MNPKTDKTQQEEKRAVGSDPDSELQRLFRAALRSAQGDDLASRLSMGSLLAIADRDPLLQQVVDQEAHRRFVSEVLLRSGAS